MTTNQENDLENTFDVFDDNIDLEKEQSPSEVEKPTEEEITETQGENQEQDNNEPPSLAKETEEKSEEEKPQESWTKAAVIDERRKRQDLERKTQELEAKILELSQGSQKQEVEQEAKPDINDDPEAALAYTEKSIDEKMFKQKVDMSRSFMESMTDKFPDYKEMETKFIEIANNDKYLSQKLREVSNPALFAYETAKSHIKNQSLSDPSYEAKLKEQIRKEVLAELVNKQNPSKSESKPVVNIPSLSNATGVQGNTSSTSSEELFADSPFSRGL